MGRLLAKLIDFREGNFALLIYDDHGPFTDAGQGRPFAENAVGFGHASMRIEVAHQGITQDPDGFFLPGDVAENGINANAHDLGIETGELIEIVVERRHLGGSSRTPIQRIEGQHEVFLAAIAAQFEGMALASRHCR